MNISELVDNMICEVVLGRTKGTKDINREGPQWDRIRPFLGKGDAVKRKCLKCGKQFKSGHIGNRVCRDCKDAQSRLGVRAEPSKMRGDIDV